MVKLQSIHVHTSTSDERVATTAKQTNAWKYQEAVAYAHLPQNISIYNLDTISYAEALQEKQIEMDISVRYLCENPCALCLVVAQVHVAR